MFYILALLSSALANTTPPPTHLPSAHQHMKAFQLAPNACIWQVGWNMRIKPISSQLPFLKYQWSPALHQGPVRGKHVNGTKSSSWHYSTQLFCSLPLQQESFLKEEDTNDPTRKDPCERLNDKAMYQSIDRMYLGMKQDNNKVQFSCYFGINISRCIRSCHCDEEESRELGTAS